MSRSNRSDDYPHKEHGELPPPTRCSQCGSIIELDARKHTIVCEYCGNVYHLSQSDNQTSIEGHEASKSDILKRALRFEKTADYREALGLYNTLLRNDNDNWAAWTGKGRCAGLLTSLGRPGIREMTDAFRTALKLAPENKKKSLKKDLGHFIIGVCAGFIEVADKGPEFAVYSLVEPDRLTSPSSYLKRIRKLIKNQDRELLLSGNYLIYQKCVLDVLVALQDSYDYLNENMDILDTMIALCHKELGYSEKKEISRRAEKIYNKCVAIRKKSDPTYRDPRAKEEFRFKLGCVIFLVIAILSVAVWFVTRYL